MFFFFLNVIYQTETQVKFLICGIELPCDVLYSSHSLMIACVLRSSMPRPSYFLYSEVAFFQHHECKVLILAHVLTGGHQWWGQTVLSSKVKRQGITSLL